MADKGPLVIFLVGALSIGGFVNYRRNAALDDELRNRSYAELSDSALVTLIQAYESELERLRGRSGAAGLQNAPTTSGRRGALLDEKIRRFEQEQRETARRRALHIGMLDQQVRVEALRKEQRIRAQGLDQRWRQILRRVVTL